MNWQEQCAVVIPCLNEAANIGPLVGSVHKYLPHVICVDDGSTDQTAMLASNAGAQVIRHERPLGKGAALASGWRRARELGFPWVLNMDGDGQHAPEDIPNFFRAAEKTNVSLVIGNRMDDPRDMPWLRRTVNRWMSRKLSEAAGQELPDTQCGFRLMRLEMWSGLPVRTSHFEIESELTLAFARGGHPIGFVPVRVIYRDERSKVHPVRDTLRWFRWWRQASLEAEVTLGGVAIDLPSSPAPAESKISV